MTIPTHEEVEELALKFYGLSGCSRQLYGKCRTHSCFKANGWDGKTIPIPVEAACVDFQAAITLRALDAERRELRVENEMLNSALKKAAEIADSYTCGGCGMDGKCGNEIRSLMTPEAK